MTYDFGVLRELRKRKNLTINKLSALCGVSYVALSKLERNHGNPELKTLERIAKSMGISVHHLLAMAARQQPILSSEKTCKILGKALCRYVDLDGTRVFLVRAPKGACGDAPEFHNDDSERCFVLDGQVKVTVRGDEYLLKPGDGLVWDSVLDHKYDVLEPATFVAVLSPKRP